MTPAINPAAAAGAGRDRDPWGIRKHLDLHRMTMEGLARKIGVTGQLVRSTVRGQANNARVLKALFELGVPEEALALPPKLRREIKAAKAA